MHKFQCICFWTHFQYITDSCHSLSSLGRWREWPKSKQTEQGSAVYVFNVCTILIEGDYQCYWQRQQLMAQDKFLQGNKLLGWIYMLDEDPLRRMDVTELQVRTLSASILLSTYFFPLINTFWVCLNKTNFWQFYETILKQNFFSNNTPVPYNGLCSL